VYAETGYREEAKPELAAIIEQQLKRGGKKNEPSTAGALPTLGASHSGSAREYRAPAMIS
jgi:hypothetical protein